VAVLLEMARQWQESGYQPSRSILFAAWGAQEAGQIGSSAYLSQPALPITNTIGVVVLDGVGGGDGHRLMAQGVWEREGLLLFGMEQADGVLDGRLRTNLPANQSDDIPFRAAGLSTMFLTWTDASEENWSDAYADEVELSALATTGRMTMLALMSVAR
jgi:Zn-dependent M28 family amino/carboxypeptidase